jgi:hypothetical protein
MELVLAMLVQLIVIRAGDAWTVADNWTAARSELVCANAVPEIRRTTRKVDH